MTTISLDTWIEDGTDPDIPDLHLIPANGYSVIRSGLTVGARVWTKETAGAPDRPGRTVTGRRLDVIGGSLLVRCGGSSTSQLFARYAAVVNAVEQYAWTLRTVIDGETIRFRCETADTAPSGDDGEAGLLDEIALMRHKQVCRVSFTRHPIALAGPF